MDHQAEPTEVWGRPLVCTHCGGGAFARRRALPTAIPVEAPDPDRPDREVLVFLCRDCGHLEWFLESTEPPLPLAEPDGIEETEAPEDLEPIEAPEDEALEPAECAQCGETIPAGHDHCPKCGWTYKQ